MDKLYRDYFGRVCVTSNLVLHTEGVYNSTVGSISDVFITVLPPQYHVLELYLVIRAHDIYFNKQSNL